MCDVVILTKNTAQVTATEEDGAGPIVALETGLFAEVRGYGVYEDVGADQTVAGCLEAVDGAQAWAEVAVGEM